MTTIFETLHENHIIFENHIINIIIDSNDLVWFKAHDLTTALGYNKQNDTIQLHIDKDDKIQLQYINHNYNITTHPHTIYINETGLYQGWATQNFIFTKLVKTKYCYCS